MTEKELIKNLSDLKNLSADELWVKKNREVLSYQIFNGNEYKETVLGFLEKFSLLTKRLLQPTPIAALIALFFVMSGFWGIRASRNATPGETLYIAKTISERAQLVATFNETAKAKLNLEFASERANEIKMVVDNEASVDQVRIKGLEDSFKKEVDSARQRLTKIESAKKVNNKTATNTATNEEVFSATADKVEDGISINESSSEKALLEAEKLFADKDYGAAAAKLDELGKQLEE